LKHSKNKIIITLLLLTTTVFAFLQFQDTVMLKSLYRTVSIRMNREGVTEQEIDHVLKMNNSRGSSDIPEVTAWIRCEEAEVINDVLKRSVRLTPLIVSGDMGLVTPMSILRGNLVYKDDKKGCVIDSDTAFKLFGSDKAEGNIVVYRNKDYYVRGVVKSKSSLFLIQGDDIGSEYKNLELLYQNKERGEEWAQDFMCQNGLGTDYVIIDGYFYRRIISEIPCIPLWLFSLAAVAQVVRFYIRKKEEFKLPVFLLLGLFGIAAIVGYGVILTRFTASPFYFPEKLIPTKWSDFDYWSKQYENIKEQIVQMRLLSPNPKDILLEDELMKLPYRFIINAILYAALYLKLVRHIVD
jgi:hypothetical protein